MTLKGRIVKQHEDIRNEQKGRMACGSDEAQRESCKAEEQIIADTGQGNIQSHPQGSWTEHAGEDWKRRITAW